MLTIGKKQKRLISLFLLVTISFTTLSLPTLAAASNPPDVQNVDAFCVFNVENQKAVAEKEMHRKVYPASTVKLMTALVAAEHFAEDLNAKITVTQEMLNASSGRHLGLVTGEMLRVTDLLHALLIGGYNDAAVILAIASAGSIDAFCRRMNEKAMQLGATATHYTNPTGLHDEAMVTTAHDTALIGLAIFNNPTLFAMTKTIKYTLPATNKSEDFSIYNRNLLITTSISEEYYYSYAEGMNLGATDEGGDCLVTAGRLDGLSYICVVMGGRVPSENDDTNYACIAAKKLLRYALISYQVKKLYANDTAVGEIPVRFSATEEAVRVVPSKELYALLHIDVLPERDITIETEILPELLDAPIPKGTVVGSIRARYNGAILDSADLITADNIESHGFLVFMYNVKQTTKHPIFIVALCLIIIGIGLLLIRRLPINKNKDRHHRLRYSNQDELIEEFTERGDS